MAPSRSHSPPLPPNATYNHPKIGLAILPSSRLFVAGGKVAGMMEVNCSSEKVALGEMALEFLGVEELRSPDHTAQTTVHGPAVCLFQGPGRPPSNAVRGDAPALGGHYYSALKGRTRFPFSFSLPSTLPSSVTFASNARVSYTLRATCQVASLPSGERSLVTKTVPVKIVERWADWDDKKWGEMVEDREEVKGERGGIVAQARVRRTLWWAGDASPGNGEVEVELKVRNSTDRDISGVRVSLCRHLALPATSAKTSPKIIVGESVIETPHHGREFTFRANMTEDRTVIARCRLPEGEGGLGTTANGSAKDKECFSVRGLKLFEVDCVVKVAIEMGAMSYRSPDLVISLPITVAQPASLPTAAHQSFALPPSPRPDAASPMHIDHLPAPGAIGGAFSSMHLSSPGRGTSPVPGGSPGHSRPGSPAGDWAFMGPPSRGGSPLPVQGGTFDEAGAYGSASRGPSPALPVRGYEPAYIPHQQPAPQQLPYGYPHAHAPTPQPVHPVQAPYWQQPQAPQPQVHQQPAMQYLPPAEVVRDRRNSTGTPQYQRDGYQQQSWSSSTSAHSAAQLHMMRSSSHQSFATHAPPSPGPMSPYGGIERGSPIPSPAWPPHQQQQFIQSPVPSPVPFVEHRQVPTHPQPSSTPQPYYDAMRSPALPIPPRPEVLRARHQSMPTPLPRAQSSMSVSSLPYTRDSPQIPQTPTPEPGPRSPVTSVLPPVCASPAPSFGLPSSRGASRATEAAEPAPPSPSVARRALPAVPSSPGKMQKSFSTNTLASRPIPQPPAASSARFKPEDEGDQQPLPAGFEQGTAALRASLFASGIGGLETIGEAGESRIGTMTNPPPQILTALQSSTGPPRTAESVEVRSVKGVKPRTSDESVEALETLAAQRQGEPEPAQRGRGPLARKVSPPSLPKAHEIFKAAEFGAKDVPASSASTASTSGSPTMASTASMSDASTAASTAASTVSSVASKASALPSTPVSRSSSRLNRSESVGLAGLASMLSRSSTVDEIGRTTKRSSLAAPTSPAIERVGTPSRTGGAGALLAKSASVSVLGAIVDATPDPSKKVKPAKPVEQAKPATTWVPPTSMARSRTIDFLPDDEDRDVTPRATPIKAVAPAALFPALRPASMTHSAPTTPALSSVTSPVLPSERTRKQTDGSRATASTKVADWLLRSDSAEARLARSDTRNSLAMPSSRSTSDVGATRPARSSASPALASGADLPKSSSSLGLEVSSSSRSGRPLPSPPAPSSPALIPFPTQTMSKSASSNGLLASPGLTPTETESKSLLSSPTQLSRKSRIKRSGSSPNVAAMGDSADYDHNGAAGDAETSRIEDDLARAMQETNLAMEKVTSRRLSTPTVRRTSSGGTPSRSPSTSPLPPSRTFTATTTTTTTTTNARTTSTEDRTVLVSRPLPLPLSTPTTPTRSELESPSGYKSKYTDFKSARGGKGGQVTSVAAQWAAAAKLAAAEEEDQNAEPVKKPTPPGSFEGAGKRTSLWDLAGAMGASSTSSSTTAAPEPRPMKYAPSDAQVRRPSGVGAGGAPAGARGISRLQDLISRWDGNA